MKYFAIALCFILITHTIVAQKKSNKKNEKGVSAVTEQSKKGFVVIETSMGNITIALNDSAAPKHSANFRKLAKENFYVGTTFHRVIPGFMIQGGDPNSKNDDRNTHGMGGPDYRIDAEIGLTHDRGVIAAARQGDMVNPERKSNGSQFYITVADAKFLDGQYSVFGKVVEGMDVADKIAAVKRDPRDNPYEKITITKVYVIE
jgi:cyclophilin family peptidyl-prolyl cis-trans isomerase